MSERFKSPEINSPERILSPEEIEQLGGEMGEYANGLRARVEEIKIELNDPAIDASRAETLRAEMDELKEQMEGLGEFVSDIEQGRYEEIVVKLGR
ncbi:hypothetical protein HZB93_00950 [Candidatus Falkowbacteria bacterium]|nr:hypothetical protein [Candidatus Falkowbacteria bacterium]